MGNSWPLGHEKLPVVARLTPAAKTAATEVFTDVVDMRYWQEVVFYFNMGNYAGGNNGSVVVKAVGNTANSTSGGTDLTGLALTTASFTGSAQDDAVGVISVRADQMVQSGTEYRYLYLSITPTNQNLTCGVIGVGLGGRYQPGSDYDLSAVTEIIGG